MAQDLRGWNFIPIEMPWEEFTVEFADLLSVNLDEGPTRTDEINLRIRAQFIELRVNEVPPTPAGHDFLGGDIPIWADIVEDLPAELGWIQRAKLACKRFGENPVHSTLILMTSERLSGATTGLLDIGRYVSTSGWRTLLFRHGEQPDVDAILDLAQRGRSVCLLFDGIGDIAEPISGLLLRARAARLPLLCVAVDRSDNSAGISGRLEPALLYDRTITSIKPRLARTDATAIVDKLASVGRLGRLEHLNDHKRIKHFNNQRLFDAMADVEGAPGFGRRVSEVVETLTDQNELQVLYLAALASRVDRDILLIDVARMTGLTSEAIVNLIQRNNVAALVTMSNERVIARQRWLALEPAIEAIGRQDSLTFLARALMNVRPRVNRESFHQGNVTAQLVGSILQFRNLRDSYSDVDLEPWYERLQPDYGWNARYWEQRAILERTRKTLSSLARAESFASRATTIRPDSYSFTTLGTVLATRAEMEDMEALGTYYDRAFDAFDTASKHDPKNLVTWLAFLRYTLPLVKRVEDNGYSSAYEDLRERVSDDWWRVYNYASSFTGASEDLKFELDRHRRHYESVFKPSGDLRGV